MSLIGNLKGLLLAEDEAFLRQIMARRLREKGFEVYGTENPGEAIRRAQQMVKDQEKVIAMLYGDHAVNHRIPVVIITTERSEKDRNRGLALGADDYLTKPFDPKELQLIVRKLLKVS